MAEGDSITNGGATAPGTYYPSDLGLVGTIIFDVGISGTTCTDMATRYATNVATRYNGAKTNAASILCGANDYFFGGITAANSYNQILSWVASAKATGFSAVVATMLSHSGAGGDAFKNTLNALITGGAAGNGYTVADFGANANMGCDGCFSNTTYFVDGIHPTVLGQSILGGIMATTLRGLGFK